MRDCERSFRSASKALVGIAVFGPDSLANAIKCFDFVIGHSE